MSILERKMSLSPHVFTVIFVWICLFTKAIEYKPVDSFNSHIHHRFVKPSNYEHLSIDYGPNGHPYDQKERRNDLNKDNRRYRHDNKDTTETENGQQDERREQVISILNYKPIRIGLVTEPIEQKRGTSTEMSTTIDYILNTILPNALSTWSKHLSVYQVYGGITISTDSCLGRFNNSGLTNQTFNSSDLVLIVHGELVSEACSSQLQAALAYASVCDTDQYGRPVVSFISFCLQAIKNLTDTTTTTTTTSEENTTISSDSDALQAVLQIQKNNNTSSSSPKSYIEVLQDNYGTFTNQSLDTSETTISLLSVVVHEIAHALGFISMLFIYFRDIDTGLLYNEINATDGTVPLIDKRCANGTILTGRYPSDNMIRTEQNTVNDLWFQYMVTPRVKQVVQNLFNCSTAPGARLEDKSECIGSHWHERHYLSELMSPIISGIGENVLSPLTLALLEDSGWYQVDYIGSQMPSFGINGGCDFLLGDCIVNDQVPSYGETEFCATPLLFTPPFPSITVSQESLVDNLYCDPTLQSWALCDLYFVQNESSFQPVNRKYFTSTNYRPEFVMFDSCPLPVTPLGLDCTKPGTYNGLYPGEQVGPGSRCFNSFFNDSLGGIPTRRPVCAKFTCDSLTLSVVVQIGTTASVVCKSDSQIVMIPGSTNGYIVCPRREALCPQFFTCPYACSGRGVCVRNTNSTDSTSLPMKCVCTDPTSTDPACASRAIVAARGPTPVAFPSWETTSAPLSPMTVPSGTNVPISSGFPSSPSMGNPPSTSPVINATSTSNPVSSPASIPMAPTPSGSIASSSSNHLQLVQPLLMLLSIVVIQFCTKLGI